MGEYNILVCVKRVPETTEVDLVIDKTGKDIEKKDLAHVVNDFDNYAVEEAVKLKEQYGGSVTVMTLGSEDSEEVLRRAMAMGADEAVRLTDPAFDGSDGYAIATALSKAIKDKSYNLILTGVQANDDGYGMVGPALAEMLGIQHATVVNKIDSLDEKKAKVHRELEGGLEEVLEVDLPAVLTIQSGINEPRYVSVMGIRKVAKKEIKILSSGDLDLKKDEVGENGSSATVEKAYIPKSDKTAEILEDTPEGQDKLLEILHDKGGK